MRTETKGEKMVTVYDRAYKIPVIVDVSSLPDESKEKLFTALSEFEPKTLSYPSEYAIEIAKELAARGWPSLARKLPINVSPTECEQILARSLQRFNAFSHLLKKPNPSVINKHIESPADFERIVDDLVGQQDEVTLSQMFGTADRSTDVFLTNRTTTINSKLSDNVIGVAKLGETEKATETRLRSIIKQIHKSIEAAKESEKVTFNDSAEHNFRYK